jgi:hypothetical protein
VGGLAAGRGAEAAHGTVIGLRSEQGSYFGDHFEIFDCVGEGSPPYRREISYGGRGDAGGSGGRGYRRCLVNNEVVVPSLDEMIPRSS